MSFHTSPGRVLFLILLLRLTSFAQSPDTVLATVDGQKITLQQVDESVALSILPLQQQP